MKSIFLLCLLFQLAFPKYCRDPKVIGEIDLIFDLYVLSREGKGKPTLMKKIVKFINAVADFGKTLGKSLF